jgi:hypothetical protein
MPPERARDVESHQSRKGQGEPAVQGKAPVVPSLGNRGDARERPAAEEDRVDARG